MALGKTVTYTPFQETSFGYGSTEIASNYSTEIPNATDVITLTITHSSGNWDDTGHISTPSSGTAISVYNKSTKQFIVKGTRSDVDVVLSQLSFYPADKPASRPYAADNLNGHKTLLYKQNQTTGDYGSAEDPPVIGDTEFTARINNASGVQKVTGTIIFDPTEPTTGNQRPFFSTAPAHSNYSTSTYDASTGDFLDFGVLAHGSDTQNVTVKGFFSPYSSSATSINTNGLLTTPFTSSNELGQFVSVQDIFVGNKLPVTATGSGLEKFNFTGSLVEAQAFLDNLRFKASSSSQQKTFNMHLTVDDGVAGSVLVKTMYHDKALTVSTLPTTQTFKEDNTATFDLGAVVFSNLDDMPEVNSYKAVITLDSTGTGGATSFGTTTTVDTETFSSGVLTIVDDNLTTFKQAIRNLEFVPVTDFNSSFTFTVVFTFENSTIGSSYASASQTINVTGQEASEVENISVTHNYTEDQVYYFKENTPLQIIHPINQAFKVDFNFMIGAQTITQVGDLNTSNTDVTKTTVVNTITFTGTRDQLNDALENLRFEPATDVNLSFPINVTVTRTGGDLTFETPSTGQFSMVGNAQTEFTFTAPAKISWNEDIAVRFDNGLEILDTSLEDPLLPAFGGSYKLTARAKYSDNSAVASSDIAFTCDDALGATISGTGTVADPLIITGDRVQINHAVQNFVMTPKADFTAAQEFRFEYQLERGLITDSYYALYLNYNQSTSFTAGTASAELEVSANNLKYGTDTIADLGNTYRIIDAAEGKNYTVTFTMDSNAPGILRATASDSATVEYRPADKRLVLKGTKVDLNNTFRTLEYVPTLGSTNDITIAFFQRQDTDTIIQTDGSFSFTLTHDPSIPKFNLDTANTDLFYAEDLQDQEDLLAFTNLKITDAAEEVLAGTGRPIHYVIEMTLNPTTEIFFYKDYAESGVLADGIVEEKASSITFTGSRVFCNEKIKSLKFSGYADQTDDVAIVYSQSRYVDNKFDELQANAQTALTLRAIAGGSAEAIFSEQKQYFTVNSALGENNESVNPRFLHTNFTGTVYKPPVVIVDAAVATGGPTLYKLEIVSSNLPTGITIPDIPFKTKTDFKEAISNGIVPQNVSDSFIESLNYGSEYEVHVKVIRRLGNGTEAEIEFNKFTYEFITPPQVFEFKDTNPNIRISTNTLGVELTSHNLITSNNPSVFTLIEEETPSRYFFGYVKKDTGTNEFYGEDIGSSQKSLTFSEISQDNFTVNEISKTSQILYNPFNDPAISAAGATTNTYSTFAPTMFGRTEASKANHICVDKFGLKTTLSINYSEVIVKYSKSFRERVWDETDSYTGEAAVLAHHTGNQNGAFTISPINKIFPETSTSDNVGNNNLVKVSDLWMSQDEIGANVYGFNNFDFTKTTPISVEEDGQFLLANQDFKVGKLSYENNTKFWLDSPGFRRIHQTPPNPDTSAEIYSFRTELLPQTPGEKFEVTNDYGSVSTIVNFAKDGVNSVKGRDAFVTSRGFQLQPFRTNNSLGNVNTSHQSYPSNPQGSGFVGSISTHLHTEKNNAYFFVTHGLELSSYGSSFPVVLFTYNNDIIAFHDPEKYVSNIQSWFDEYDNLSHTRDVTYDYVMDTSDVTNIKLLLVRSYKQNTNAIVNEAILLKQITDTSSGKISFEWQAKFKETIADRMTINRYVTDVPSGYEDAHHIHSDFISTDKNRWARRCNVDNVPRIKLFNNHFVLPTGSAIMKRGANSYELTTLEEILGVDIRGKAIDQYIELPGNKLAYVSVAEGRIDDGLGNINIRLDSNNFYHIYITNDINNPFDFYGIMSKKLMGHDIIGDEVFRSGSSPTKKMFMFKAPEV